MALTPTTDLANVIDLTGLPEKAVEAVRSIVEELRQQAGTSSGPALYSTREEWIKAIREWANSHQPEATAADWNRERIYAGAQEPTAPSMFDLFGKATTLRTGEDIAKQVQEERDDRHES